MLAHGVAGEIEHTAHALRPRGRLVRDEREVGGELELDPAEPGPRRPLDPFDLDGDGYQPGDDFFAGGENRATIGEEPVWLYIPVLEHDTVEMDNENFIVMEEDNIETWRVLSDTFKGAGDHTLDLYFTVFVGTIQFLAHYQWHLQAPEQFHAIQVFLEHPPETSKENQSLVPSMLARIKRGSQTLKP